MAGNTVAQINPKITTISTASTAHQSERDMRPGGRGARRAFPAIDDESGSAACDELSRVGASSSRFVSSTTLIG
jgi:hypothetical protein